MDTSVSSPALTRVSLRVSTAASNLRLMKDNLVMITLLKVEIHLLKLIPIFSCDLNLEELCYSVSLPPQ